MKATVLFVDDEPNILSGLRRSTRGRKDEWNMIFAEGGEAAQEAIANNKIDAVVTDMRMPQIDGADVLRYAAENAPTSIRFVLSGEADLDLTTRAIHYSHQFHSKPCDDGVLLTALTIGLSLRNELKSARSLSQISIIDKLGASPATIRSLAGAIKTNSDNTSALASAIRQSPGLTIRVLQLANSSYFGPRRETCKIEEALNAISLDVLNKLISRNIFDDHLSNDRPDFEENEGLLARTVFKMGQGSHAQHAAHATACLLELCTWLDDNEAHSPFPAIYVARLLGFPPVVSDIIARLTRFDIEASPAENAQTILEASESHIAGAA